MPGPVLTSGEPLALWVFVSPKQQQQAREGCPEFLSQCTVPWSSSSRGKARGCGCFGQGCEYLVENQDGTGCCEGRVRSCVGLQHAVGSHHCALAGLFRGRQQTPPSLWGVGAANQRGGVCSKSLKLLLEPDPWPRKRGWPVSSAPFPALLPCRAASAPCLSLSK